MQPRSFGRDPARCLNSSCNRSASIVGSSVGKPTLQQTPDALVGIELGGVGRKVLKV
jgi:hypothetical protein